MPHLFTDLQMKFVHTAYRQTLSDRTGIRKRESVLYETCFNGSLHDLDKKVKAALFSIIFPLCFKLQQIYFWRNILYELQEQLGDNERGQALGILLAQSKPVFSVMLRRQASIGKCFSGDSCGFGFYILTLL